MADCRLRNVVRRIAECRWVLVLGATAALAAVGCGAPASPTLTTGLTGTVTRSPVTPVCTVNVPCSAPFSAGFSVNRGGATVAHFRSDADGHFTVMLTPATYHIVPDADAPLIAPTSQIKTVTVQDAGLTMVSLEFDTGIR